MSGRYTCQRCLTLIRTSSRSQPSHRFQLAASTIRWHSSNHRASSSPACSAVTKRSSSTAPHTNYTSEPLPSVPPGYQYAHRDAEEARSRLILQRDNLFHPFSKSPSPEIRRRAAFIKQHAYCPHPSHQRTRVPTSPLQAEARQGHTGEQAPAHVKFECPDCGIPVYCCEEHWQDDYENHLEICDTLRTINEDDHDLRSGRLFNEFEYPGQQLDEILVNMTNWDTFLFTREFEAINDERALRQATKLLTYPVTVGSVLHELSPYNVRKGGRLTPEGLRSMSALRYSLHPPRSGAGKDVKSIRLNPPPMRIFVLGARAESSLPREVWAQLAYMFPRVAFHLILIGPESMTNRDAEYPLPERTAGNPFGAVIEDRFSKEMKISTYVEYYQTLHQAQHFHPYDPYFDCFVLFHPGLGHPASSAEWEDALPMLLETKVPIIVTGFSEWDMQRDIEWVKQRCAGEMDILLEPGENRFRSLRWDLNDLDPQDISAGNWGVWAFRGKRYEAQKKESTGTINL